MTKVKVTTKFQRGEVTARTLLHVNSDNNNQNDTTDQRARTMSTVTFES